MDRKTMATRKNTNVEKSAAALLTAIQTKLEMAPCAKRSRTTPIGKLAQAKVTAMHASSMVRLWAVGYTNVQSEESAPGLCSTGSGPSIKKARPAVTSAIK